MNIKGEECFSQTFLGLTTVGNEVTVKYLQSEIKSHRHSDWFILRGCGLLSFSSCFMVNCIGLCFLLYYEPLKAVTSLSFHGISPPSILHPPPGTFMPLHLAQCPKIGSSGRWVDVMNPCHLTEDFEGDNRGSIIQER